MCQNDLIFFQHIYEESKNIYKLTVYIEWRCCYFLGYINYFL